MKKLIILCSLIFSSIALADVGAVSTNDNVEISINQDLGSDKGSIEQLYYNFGIIPVNMRTWVNFYVNNNGSTPLFLQNASLYGGGNFGARHNCRVLYPGQRCNFTLEFMPFFEGYHTGEFVLTFDQAQVRVRMSGQAVRR